MARAITNRANYWSDDHRRVLWDAAYRTLRRWGDRHDVDAAELVNHAWLRFARKCRPDQMGMAAGNAIRCMYEYVIRVRYRVPAAKWESMRGLKFRPFDEKLSRRFVCRDEEI